jgi:hypothetical protein
MCVGLAGGLNCVKPRGHGHDIRPGPEPCGRRRGPKCMHALVTGRLTLLPLGQRRCDACLPRCAVPVRLINAWAFPGSAIRASHDQREGHRVASWLSAWQRDWHGKMAADVLGQTGRSDSVSGTWCSFRFLTGAKHGTPRTTRTWRRNSSRPGTLVSRAASDCDITNAMTPITGGCGLHCTVAADRPGHAREAHCGCRECHGGGRAPVTRPGWGKTPARVVATRPAQPPTLA